MKENHQAVAEKIAYERGVLDSARAYREAYSRVGGCVAEDDIGLRGILSLLGQTVWEHEPGCPTPFQWNEKLRQWTLPSKVDGITECICKSWSYCPSCGARKPQENP